MPGPMPGPAPFTPMSVPQWWQRPSSAITPSPVTAGSQLFYSSTAVQTTVAADFGTDLAVNSITGFPVQYPFTLLLEWGTANQEVVTVTQAATLAPSGAYLFANCARGADGTQQVAHAPGAQVNHGVSARDFLQVAPVFNVCAYGADPTGTLDSTTAIQAAITAAATAGGGVVYIPAGTYKLSAALTVAGSGITIQGAGSGSAILQQTSATANGITIAATTLASVKVAGLRINGPNSGSGVGLQAAANSGTNPITQMTLEDLIVYQFGSHGVYTQNTIASTFTRVQSVNNSARGFWLVNGTSTKLVSCYANTNPNERGYYIQFLNYSGLDSCAADGNAIGYEIYQCDNTNIINCGAEDTAAGTSGLDGSSFKVNGSTSCAIRGARVVANAAVGLYFTGNSVECSLDGFNEFSVSGSPTASIKVDAGCFITAANYNAITAQSFATGTTSIINNFGYTFLPTGEVGALSADNPAKFFGQGTGGGAINITSGALRTTAAAGDIEYDGTAFYATAAASSRQVADAEQFVVNTATRTFTANTSAQPIWTVTANGALTVAATTSYFFESEFDITGLSGSAHTVSLTFGGTATYTSAKYMADVLSPFTAGTFAAWPTTLFTAATIQTIVASGTNTSAAVRLRGILRINGAGTVIPQITQGTASAAAVVGVNSWFRIWPVGSNTVTSVGNWS